MALETKSNSSGQFGSLTRKRKSAEPQEFNIEDYNYLAQKDRRMRFNNIRRRWIISRCILDI